ncbi:hypothetical protein COLO4_07966 [Corchorus olitorius]|uniref:Uncharacterized protein n=1 Tax=Corchorus olitorius TaxID=93759 RepID=A0A1R3KI15_9ROSI|nr:hypothetical protein COLO4_07966 [Corchorus olitorius]
MARVADLALRPTATAHEKEKYMKVEADGLSR